MGRARRNPFRGLIDHISEMNRLEERWLAGRETGREEQRRTHITAWVPATDIFAKGKDLVIRMELAGVRQQDIDVALSGGVLTISGERSFELDEEEISYYVRERFFGTFRRSMNLPEGVDESKISASFEDGMLEIIIEGGAVTVEPRHIKIDSKSG